MYYKIILVSILIITLTGTSVLTPLLPLSFAQDGKQVNVTSTLESLTGIPYPDISHENQDAIEHTKKFYPSHVTKVIDGVYSAIGYGMANIMMVEGTDGIVIVDAGETNEQAEQVLSEFHKITKKPIVAVIYTHNHVDHTEGGGVFVNDGEKAGKQVDVIGQETLIANYYKSYGALGPQQATFSYRWGGTFLPIEGEDRIINAGIGPFVHTGNTSFTPPNVTFKDTLEKKYAGLKFVIGHQPGETPDELYVWIPEKKVLFAGENIYELFPNLYSMRGTKYRDVSLWIDSLDKLRSFNATYMVPSHTGPVIGQENVSKILTTFRDGVAYIYDQTIRNINKGLDPEDLAITVKLPPYLANSSWLQERYGQISWMPRGIYSGEVGWNTGDPTWFNPVTKEERGHLLIEGFGGLNQTISMIKQAIIDKRYNWAAELATYVLDAYPNNNETKLLKAQAFRILAWMNPTSGSRNWYLTDARILEGKLDPTLLNTLHGAQERILNTPTDILLNLFRFNLDPNKSGDMHMTVGITLNDTNKGYTFEVRKAVLEFQKSFPSKFDVAIITDTNTLKKIIAGITTIDDAVNNGNAKIDGDVNDLTKFISVLDKGLKGQGEALDASVG